MIRGLCLFLILSSCSLWAQNRVIDHLQTDVSDIRERLRHFKVERELLEDRLQAQGQEIADLKKELTHQHQSQSTLVGAKSEQLGGRLNSLEKGQEALTTDLKQLKKHLNDTSEVINKLSDHVEQNQTAMKGQIQDLKKAVESLVGLLQKPSGSSYKVKAGDNLEKIAKSTGCSVDTLRKLNNLTNDRIIVGRELRLE